MARTDAQSPARHPVTSRRQSNRANFPGFTSDIVQADGADAGWLAVAALPGELRLVEIMIAPKLRGQGIDAAVIGQILASADDAGTPVRLRVNVTNHRAIRLYERLGFRRVDGDEVQHVIERSANP